ncbi:MAG: cobalamin-dependent protein [Pseudomonadota bacterium]
MKDEILSNLKEALIKCDRGRTASWAGKALEENIDPLVVMDTMIEAIRWVGEGFGKGDLFLPELIGAAEAMQSASPIVEKEIEKRAQKRESLGTVIIGTVFGDIHTIGKSLVAALLIAGGFEVHDMGINIPTDRFVEAVKTFKPDILAMSTLLTTTASEAKNVIDALKERGLRDEVKIMVGGGAMTETYSESIGADGYDATAPGAVNLARCLLGL